MEWLSTANGGLKLLIEVAPSEGKISLSTANGGLKPRGCRSGSGEGLPFYRQWRSETEALRKSLLVEQNLSTANGGLKPLYFQ